MSSTKRPFQHFPMVEVWWDDATEMEAGWTDEVTKSVPSLALSAGFLLQKNKDYVIIALDTDEQGHHNGRSQIPAGMVKKIKILRKADK